MAHHKATLKNIKKIKTQTEYNVSRRSRVKSFVKKVELAVANKDKKAAPEALRVAQKELMRGVSKGVLKLKPVSRKISRLNAKVKSLFS